MRLKCEDDIRNYSIQSVLQGHFGQKIFHDTKIFRSSQLVEAYTTVREILQRFLADDDEWTESLAASAKGSLIYSWTEKEETVEDLVGQTVKAYMRQTDTKYNRCDKL